MPGLLCQQHVGISSANAPTAVRTWPARSRCHQEFAGLRPTTQNFTAEFRRLFPHMVHAPPEVASWSGSGVECQPLAGLLVFDALGGAWRLTAAQRDRLAPAVGEAGLGPAPR